MWSFACIFPSLSCSVSAFLVVLVALCSKIKRWYVYWDVACESWALHCHQSAVDDKLGEAVCVVLCQEKKGRESKIDSDYGEDCRSCPAAHGFNKKRRGCAEAGSIPFVTFFFS